MNKYQKALSELKNSDIKLHVYNDQDNITEEHQPTIYDFYHDEIFVLKELVEKTIPKKPEMMRIKNYDGYNVGICKCGKTIDTSLDDDVNFCPKCGQAIDWSDEE